MGALVDSLRDAIADGDTKNKDEAVDNIKETLQLASRRLLNSAKNGDTELDVKDLKDLASVYAMLSQTDGGDEMELLVLHRHLLGLLTYWAMK